VAWSPDGKRLASVLYTSGDHLVVVWDAGTGQRLSTMRGHNDNVDAIVWSPDGKRVASASLDNSVRIWDPVTGEETFVLRGNAGMFYDVSWNPDGAQLAAACSDGQIWIWDATPGFKQNPTMRPAPSSPALQAKP
jgi:WD40 repeat protein